MQQVITQTGSNEEGRTARRRQDSWRQ